MPEVGLGSFLDRLRRLGVDAEPDAAGTPRSAIEAPVALDTLRRLRDAPETSMQRLVDLTAIDRGGARFEVVYRLHAPGSNERLRIHVPVEGELPTLDSVVPLWRHASWLEREVFDLFGICFRGHPNLRRLLLPQDFEGAPLRKDYPRQPHLDLPKDAEP